MGADGDAGDDDRIGADPDVVADDDAPAGLALFPDRNVVTRRAVVAGADDDVRPDHDPAAHLDAAEVCHDAGVAVDGDAAAHAQAAAAAGAQHRAGHQIDLVAQRDAAGTADLDMLADGKNRSAPGENDTIIVTSG